MILLSAKAYPYLFVKEQVGNIYRRVSLCAFEYYLPILMVDRMLHFAVRKQLQRFDPRLSLPKR